MKRIPLSTKLSVVSVLLIVTSIVVLGFYFDTFLKKQYFKDSKNRIIYAKNMLLSDFVETKKELKDGLEFVESNEELLASMELINNYQDKENYNHILLDEEKKDISKTLLQKIKTSFNTNIKLYDKNGDLVAYVYRDSKGYKQNFISYIDAKKIIYSKYENDKEYMQSLFLDDVMMPHKHVDYYTQKLLKEGVVITEHFINNVLYIQSHKSIFDKYDHDKTLFHIQMSKGYDQAYFNRMSKSLNTDVFLSQEKKYAELASNLYEDATVKNEEIHETEKEYFDVFSVLNDTEENLYLVFSLDKSFLKSVLDKNRLQLFIFLFMSVILMFVLFSLMIKYGLIKPLDGMMKQIEKIQAGDYTKGEIIKTSDELEVISVNIYKLANAVKKREKKLEYLSGHDELTGLLNRRKFKELLDRALKRSKRNGTHLAVLFLDLDQFKQVNDTLGHSVGDKLLKLVSNRLEASLRESDVLARVGGDEFNIFIEGFKNLSEVHMFAQKIIDEFEEPYAVKENDINISTSIGVSIYPDDGIDTETLTKNADIAMYMSKDRGRNNYSFYSTNLSEVLQKRMDVIYALKSAIKDQNEFILYYQPKISIKTKKIVGVEALVRWNSPTLGFVRPDQFISIAEETHLIIDVGKWILNQACKDFVLLEGEGYKLEHMSINISAIQLQYSDLFETVKETLKSTNMPASNLELEVTESYIATNEQSAIETLSKFREMGIELAIDDFGTGYSSMSYLQKLPITRLKIDKAFVDDLPEAEENVAVVKAIIALAEAFNLKITIEGVENEKQLDFFNGKNCDDIQGFVYSEPLLIDELKEFIVKHS